VGNLCLRKIIAKANFKSIVATFNQLYFHHVYRERNDTMDGFSKAGLMLEIGQ
jgi:hypothetical protein